MLSLTFLKHFELPLCLLPGFNDFGVLILWDLILKSPMKVGSLYSDSTQLLLVNCYQCWINLFAEKEFLYSFHGYNKLDKLANEHWKGPDGLVDDVEDSNDRDGQRQVD